MPTATHPRRQAYARFMVKVTHPSRAPTVSTAQLSTGQLWDEELRAIHSSEANPESEADIAMGSSPAYEAPREAQG